MEECWREIAGYSGRYAVSNFGRIKSLCRDYTTGANSVTVHLSESIMKQKVKRNGYCVVGLWINGIQTDKYVHRLVAEAFVDNPNKYSVVNHKDQNPRNNRADNLEWCTYQYNATYKDAHLIGADKRCKPIVQKTLDGDVVRIWRSAYDAGLSFENKYAAHNINNVLKNPKRRIAYGYVWEYV